MTDERAFEIARTPNQFTDSEIRQAAKHLRDKAENINRVADNIDPERQTKRDHVQKRNLSESCKRFDRASKELENWLNQIS